MAIYHVRPSVLTLFVRRKFGAMCSVGASRFYCLGCFFPIAWPKIV